jgi:NAD(P)-dependent dehydrogenase (short-subunit alcohol dehydrogenase family)
MTDPPHTLVVGGSRGTGRVVARTAGEAGHRVSVIARSEPAEGLPASVAVHQADLRDEDAVLRAVADAACAGPFGNVVFMQRYRGEAGEDDWAGELATGVESTRQIVDAVVAAGEPPTSIVMTSSLAGEMVVGDQSLGYHVAKAALNQMVRYYAVTLAARGIRVNGLVPGQILKEEAEQYFRENPSDYEKRVLSTPLRRMGTAQEMADVVMFLCSPSAAFITGQLIVADGGLSLLWQGALVPPGQG